MSFAVVACGGESTEDSGPVRDEWQSETTVEGDVTTVRTLSGSVWGAPAQVAEELSIGVEQGEAAYMFGRLGGVSGQGDKIYILDTSVPAVRVYDDAGTHLMDIGTEGDGPGEFRNPDALLVAPDGRVFVRDSRQGRITIFDAEGGLIDTLPLDQGFVMITGTGMVLADDGKLYNPGRIGDPPENMSFSASGGSMRMPRMEMGMVPRGTEGIDGDPIPQPQFDYEAPRFQQVRRSGENVMISMRSVPFAAGNPWAMASSRAMVAGVATDYSFDIIYPDGGTTRVAMDYEPVPLEGAERDWHIEQVTAQMREGQEDWVWEGPEMATVKPAYAQLLPDNSGRVWVGRQGPGVEVPECERDEVTGVWDPVCWRDTTLFDVFDLEGAYLGSVQAPVEFRITGQSWIQGDEILTPVEDEFGVITVKRYRLVTPADAP